METGYIEMTIFPDSTNEAQRQDKEKKMLLLDTMQLSEA
jgi:hypothetical protein